MTWRKTLFIASAAFCIAWTSAANANDQCKALLDAALKSDLTLSYQEFDQTQGQGFRPLVGKRCFKEAADLIEAYIAATDATQSSLIWHIAQLRAAQGDYASALTRARASLNENEDLTERPLRWNDYVLGVIAFLERDKSKLIDHRHRVAEGVDAYQGNALNRDVLDKLIDNFDLTYAEAIH